MGAKLLDETIDPDRVLAGTLESQTLVERPTKMAIGIDWPEEVYTTPEGLWSIIIGDEELPLSETSIGLLSPSRDGALGLAVSSEDKRGEFELELYEENEAPNYRFLLRSDERVQIRRASFEGRTNSINERFPIKFKCLGKAVQVVKILHAAIRNAEFHHRFELF